MMENTYEFLYFQANIYGKTEKNTYLRIWRMLKENGILAVYWKLAPILYQNNSVIGELNQVKKIYIPEAFSGYHEEDLNNLKQTLRGQLLLENYFTPLEWQEFEWMEIYDADDYISLMHTLPEVQQLSEDMRQSYLSDVRLTIREQGGVVEMPQITWMYLIKKQL